MKQEWYKCEEPGCTDVHLRMVSSPEHVKLDQVMTASAPSQEGSSIFSGAETTDCMAERIDNADDE